MKHNQFTWLFVCCLFVAAFVLSACTQEMPTPTALPTPEAIALTDGLDRSVELAKPAQRVVSLASSNTEILYAIGAGDLVVARDAYSDYPEEAKAVPSIGDGINGFDKEMIVSLKPDLVLAAEINTPEQVQEYADLGMTVYWLKNPTSLEEMYENLRIVAKLTGKSQEAEALITSLERRVAAVDEAIGKVSDLPTVFYELDSTDVNAPWTAGPGTFIDLLMKRAHASNAAAELEGQWVQMSLEALLKINPAVILLGDAAYGVTLESVEARPGWEALGAVSEKQIFAFDDNLVSRPGPRLVDGYETLAKLLHPEAFE
jgi:iron complex transport system substrate-binding protein